MSTIQPEDEVEPAQALVVTALGLELERRGDVMPAMTSMLARLGASLTRWIGADGWLALVRRALAESVRIHGDSGLSLDDLGRLHAGAGGVTQGNCEQLLVAIEAVLGRFVGPEMALRLIEQGLAEGDGQTPGGSNHG